MRTKIIQLLKLEFKKKKKNKPKEVNFRLIHYQRKAKGN